MFFLILADEGGTILAIVLPIVVVIVIVLAIAANQPPRPGDDYESRLRQSRPDYTKDNPYKD